MPKNRNQHVLFTLDEGATFRLSCNDLQWILERGSPKRCRLAKDSGYRGVSFVASRRTVLMRCIHEGRAVLTPQSAMLLEVLPSTFAECRDFVRSWGVEALRRRLHECAGLTLELTGGPLAA